jgi:hypothetical protein
LKHLKTYKGLFESTSAGSHERGAETPPFKYSKVYDHRLGYTKNDFCEDLEMIYKELSTIERRELMDVIFRFSGAFRINTLRTASQEAIDKLIPEVEKYLDARANYRPIILPDGYMLCYNGVKYSDAICDLYYSPYEGMIKIAFVNEYPEIDEKYIDFEDFNPATAGIKQDDFDSVVAKCDRFSKREL